MYCTVHYCTVGGRRDTPVGITREQPSSISHFRPSFLLQYPPFYHLRLCLILKKRKSTIADKHFKIKSGVGMQPTIKNLSLQNHHFGGSVLSFWFTSWNFSVRSTRFKRKTQGRDRTVLPDCKYCSLVLYMRLVLGMLRTFDLIDISAGYEVVRSFHCAPHQISLSLLSS
jgi:hypothetical protein